MIKSIPVADCLLKNPVYFGVFVIVYVFMLSSDIMKDKASCIECTKLYPGIFLFCLCIFWMPQKNKGLF